jgi:hypothetical protein
MAYCTELARPHARTIIGQDIPIDGDPLSTQYTTPILAKG